MENQFCDFLINIGLIDLKESKKLKEINSKLINDKNIKNFSDRYFISLMQYLNNLTKSQKKFICFNLPLRFLINKEREKKQKITLIILKKELKEKILKLKYLLAWIRQDQLKKIPLSKQISGDSLLSNKLSFDAFLKRKETKLSLKKKNMKNKNINNKNSNEINILKKEKANSLNKPNKDNNNNNSTKPNDNINNKDILTTSDRLEMLQLSECTFKPSINTTNNSFRNTNINSELTTFEKLYKDNEKYKMKKQLKEIEYENILNKDLTFRPNFFQTPRPISNIKFEKFDVRQQNFIKNKFNNANRLKKNVEKYNEKKCSFSPKINNKFIDFSLSSKNNGMAEENKNKKAINNYDNNYSLNTVKTIPAHERLYNDSKRRNNSYIQKEIEYQKLINELASRNSKSFSKVDYKKLKDLYENKKKKILEKTKKKVEEEEGLTFKPELNLNNKYAERICSDFYERNSNLKKNRIFEKYDNFYGEEKKRKKYTEDEKKEIINNIVKRLYNEQLTQHKLNNKNEGNKYVKNNNLVDYSRTKIPKQICEINTKIN